MVCLLDLDLRAPSIYSIFKNNAPHWVNDYLSKACKIETVLSDCTSKDMDEGKRARFEKKTGIITNKIPFEYFSAENPNNSITLATHQLPIVGVVPCFCDILAAGGNAYSPPKNQTIRSQKYFKK
jgi:hypothetical protein